MRGMGRAANPGLALRTLLGSECRENAIKGFPSREEESGLRANAPGRAGPDRNQSGRRSSSLSWRELVREGGTDGPTQAQP